MLTLASYFRGAVAQPDGLHSVTIIALMAAARKRVHVRIGILPDALGACAAAVAGATVVRGRLIKFRPYQVESADEAATVRARANRKPCK